MAIATFPITSNISLAVRKASAIEDLRRRITGEVVTPEDAGYEDARKVQILNYNRRPSAIVRAASTEDVAEAVRFAREQGISLAVRSGGHSIPGLSMVDGVVTIDLSGMKAVRVDPATRTARVEAGATSGDVAGPAHEHGLAITTGDTSSVGMGGLVTGGGIGLMARKFGLTIDNLISATVVTADGEIRTASTFENEDLFWAIRGGGGNFGIVTEFELRLAEVDQVLGGVILLPPTREVLRGVLDYTPTAPDGLTVLMNVMHAPPAPFVPEDRVGELVIMLMVTWTGDLAEGERAIEPLRALGEPIADTIEAIPYPAIYNYTAELTERHGVVVRQMFADDFSDDAIDSVLEAMGRATSPMSLAHFRGQGGAIAKVAGDATAFAHRTQKYFVAAIAVWPDDSDATPHEAWTDDLWQRIRPEGNGVYVNFLANEGEERIAQAYPETTMARLREVKTKYDPENVFRYNQNIKPL
jgi:FAD/FMN-containing dehydrogenase